MALFMKTRARKPLARGEGNVAINPQPGYRSCRIIDGKPCRCTVAWMTENGNCPCSPNVKTAIAVIPLETNHD
jgi:hypothetical protein